MQFRITSITDPEIGARVSEATTRIEDWLNASLHDGQFGEGLDQITFFVVSAFEDSEENERWATARDKLGRAKNPLTGKSLRHLSFGVAVSPAQFRVGGLEQWARVVAVALREKLRSRPKRVAKGFDYEMCAAGISAALGAYDTV